MKLKFIYSLLLIGASGLPVSLYGAVESESIVGMNSPQRYVIEEQASNATSLPARINIKVSDSSLKFVLMELARQAGLRIVGNDDDVLVKRRITVSLNNADALNAFSTVLKGTRFTASLTADKSTVVIAKTSIEKVVKEAAKQGVVAAGTVIDSLTGSGINGVTVTVSESRLSTVTTRTGGYIIRDIPPGNVVLNFKLLGYHSKSVPIVIPSDTNGSVITNVKLAQTTTSLAEVVTTVTGMQRKVEIGNDITTIKVDEVMKTNPVSNLSEMLTNRVPGLYAAKSSGLPGAPTRIRIRGVSSLNTSNDPIIVIDGVQVRSQGNAGKFMEGVEAGDITNMSQSPLDQIDINSIETIEVLKGPSAVALYGSDAANGVIVITRKKGIAGTPKWSSNIRLGTESVPGKWPQNYFAWGTFENFGGLPTHCILEYRTGLAKCRVDSISVYQILNDRETSPLGRGTSTDGSVTFSGGTDKMTYSLTGSHASTLGLVRLPRADLRMLRAAGEDVTENHIRPTGSTRNGVSAISNMGLIKRTDLLVSLALTKSDIRSTPLSDAVRTSMNFPPPQPQYDAAGNIVVGKSGTLDAISNFRELQKNGELGTQAAIALSTNYLEQFNGRINVGLDVRGMERESYLGRGQCYSNCGGIAAQNNDSVGVRTKYNGRSLTGDMNTNLSFKPVGNRILNIIPVVGFNYTYNSNSNIGVRGRNLPLGISDASRAAEIIISESYSNSRTAGAYLETRLNIGDRLWLPFAIRSDAGSALGGNVMPKFPKLSFSYLISEQPAFSRIPIAGKLKELRVRAAFGVSGKQPLGTEKYRTYGSNGVEGVGEFVDMVSIGNPNLKPEQSTEWEYGGEAYFLDNDRGRLSLNLTIANKRTRDLIVSEKLSASLGAPIQYYNLGSVQNKSFEGDINGAVHTRLATVTGQLQISVLRNKLVSLNESYANLNVGAGMLSTSTGGYHVIGYPLYGKWARDIVGFSDINGDGNIQRDEVQMSDNAVFIGAPYPKYTMSFQGGVILFNRLTINSVFGYEDGMTQSNTGSSISEIGKYEKVNNDTSLSQKEQAYGLYSALARTQSISSLRWTSAQITYVIPSSLSKRIMGSRTISVAVDGKNIGLWSSYRGKDPNVGAIGEDMADRGQIPAPRSFGISMRVY